MNKLKELWSKIKTLISLKKGVTKIKEDYMTKGLKSSELWLTVLGVIANVWAASQGMISAELSLKIITVAIGVYTVARGIAKITTTKKDDELLDKIEALFKK